MHIVYVVMTVINGYKNIYAVCDTREIAEQAKERAEWRGCWDYVYILEMNLQDTFKAHK